MMRKTLFLLILFVFVGCNSKEAALTSIEGLRDPSDPFPMVISVSTPSNGLYSSGAILEYYVSFSEDVTVDGIPSLPIQLNSGIAQANYIGGSGTSLLIFRYTVANGEWDNDGIALTGKINLNGGSIYNLDDDDDAILNYSAPSTPLIRILAQTFAFSSIVPPANGSYKVGSNVDFKVNFTGPVTVSGGTPEYNFTANSITRHAVYVSGSGTSQLVFRYIVPVGENANGINAPSTGIVFNGSTLQDPFGNNVSGTVTAPGTLTGVKIDGVNPTSNLYVNQPTDGTFYPSQLMSFSLNFSENIAVTGTPRLKLKFGSTTRDANFTTVAGNTIIFSYFVQPGDNDNSGGIEIESLLDLSSGGIKDIAGNDYTPSAISIYANNIIVDTTPASVIGLNILKLGSPPYTFRKNENIDIQVNLNSVARCSVSPLPYIEINIGGTIKRASCMSTTLSSQLLFRYAVEGSLTDTDGIQVGPNINMNGGFIKDGTIIETNSSTGNFAVVTDTQALVDSFAYITSVDVVNGMRSYQPGESIDVKVNFSEIVSSSGPIVLKSTIGATMVPFNVFNTTSNSITFRHTVVANEIDWDGIVFDNSLFDGVLMDASSQSVKRNIPASFEPRIFAVPSLLNQWYDLDDIHFVNATLTPPKRVQSIANKTTETSYTISGTNNPLYLDDGNAFGMQFMENVGVNVGLQNITNIIVVYTTVPSFSVTDKKLITFGSNFFSFRNDGYVGDAVITQCSNCAYFDGYNWQAVLQTFFFTGEYYLSPFIPVINQKKILSLKVPTGAYNFSLGPSLVGGMIYEIITFSSNPPLADLTKVHNYLKTKHNVDF